MQFLSFKFCAPKNMWRKMLKLLLRMGDFNFAENHHHENVCFQESMLSTRDFDHEPCQQMSIESGGAQYPKMGLSVDSMRVDTWGCCYFSGFEKMAETPTRSACHASHARWPRWIPQHRPSSPVIQIG